MIRDTELSSSPTPTLIDLSERIDELIAEARLPILSIIFGVPSHHYYPYLNTDARRTITQVDGDLEEAMKAYADALSAR